MANENEVFEFDNIEPVPIVSKNRNLAVSYLQKKSIDEVIIRSKKTRNCMGSTAFIMCNVIFFYCTPDVATSEEIFLTNPCSTAPGPTSTKVSAPAATIFWTV